MSVEPYTVTLLRMKIKLIKCVLMGGIKIATVENPRDSISHL